MDKTQSSVLAGHSSPRLPAHFLLWRQNKELFASLAGTSGFYKVEMWTGIFPDNDVARPCFFPSFVWKDVCG